MFTLQGISYQAIELFNEIQGGALCDKNRNGASGPEIQDVGC